MRFNKAMSITAEQRMNYDATEIKLVEALCSGRALNTCRCYSRRRSFCRRRRCR